MSTMTFKLTRDYWDCGNLYRYNFVNIENGLTVLVGCNGSGKSTLLLQINDECEKLGIPHARFDNIDNGGSRNYYGLMGGWFSGGIGELAALQSSSEGEKITQNMSLYFDKIHKASKECVDKGLTNLVVMYDAVDSGASIDTIMELKELFRLIITEEKERNNIDVYLIVVANSYEMVNGERCLDVYSGEYRTFSSYDNYKKFILSTRKRKEHRYELCEKRAKKKMEKKQREMEEGKDGKRSNARRSVKRDPFIP